MSNNERVNKVDIHKDFYDGRKKIILVFQILYKFQFHEKKIDGNRSTRWKTITLLLQKEMLKNYFQIE